MINFFRKTRKKMADDNKPMKYMRYAVGEIALVVIGILIALQINTWNEIRKSKIIEQQLLTSLLQEFETNLDILDKTIETNTKIIGSCIKIGKFTGPLSLEVNERELSETMAEAFKYESRYVPIQGTIVEINNSGKLSFISDPALRKAISEWQSQLELVKNQENYVVAERDYSHQFFINNGNFRRHLDIIEDELIDVESSKFPKNDFAFLEKQEFESNLYLFIVASINLNKTFYLPLKEQIELLMKQIKRNIE